jgi:hypothetical protein
MTGQGEPTAIVTEYFCPVCVAPIFHAELVPAGDVAWGLPPELAVCPECGAPLDEIARGA